MRKSNVSALARAARPAVRSKIKAVRVANSIESRVLNAIRHFIPYSDQTDAVSVLKNDHNHIESLFDRFARAKTKAQKLRLAREICITLTAHSTVEEELFYPQFRGLVDNALLDESYVEHDSTKVLIAEIMAGSPSDTFWDAKVTVLCEEVRHHLREEEKWDGLFGKARMTGVDMKALGRRIEARKKVLMQRYRDEGLPSPETRTLIGAEVRRGRPIDNTAHYRVAAH